MERERKVWGWTIELFRNNTTSTHYLEIRKGGYCSEHRHAQKNNIFYVISGTLEIFRWLDTDMVNTLLTPGDCFIIQPGDWHKFRAFTAVRCIEIYDYTYDGVDIERRTEGGLKNA